jgi:hypothetical protein
VAFETKHARILADAAGKLDRIHSEYPGSRSKGIYYQARGLLAALKGDWNSAKRDLAGAHEVWPDVNSSFFAAEVLHRTGDLPQAAGFYERVLERKGSALRREGVVIWVRSLAGAGLVACDLKQPQVALQRLEQFLQHWGNNPKLPVVRQVQLQAAACGQA